MIRLKQKKAEEEKKANDTSTAATAAKVLAATTTVVSNSSNENAKMDTETSDEKNNNITTGALKLLGIGGKASRATVPQDAKKSGRKKTPGEIRIQKGIYFTFISLVIYDY